MWITLKSKRVIKIMNDEIEINLFGEHQPIPKISGTQFVSRYMQFKIKNRYRKSFNNSSSCRYCSHCLKFNHHDKTYYKCALMGVSNSAATDIRLSYVCSKFKNKNAVLEINNP